jgi:ATP-dependent Clp protease ATP-binding subunit ClpA
VLSPSCTCVFAFANQVAHSFNAPALKLIHLLLSMLGVKSGVAYDILTEAGVLRDEIDLVYRASVTPEGLKNIRVLPPDPGVAKMLDTLGALERERELQTSELLHVVLRSGDADIAYCLRRVGVNAHHLSESVRQSVQSERRDRGKQRYPCLDW